mgnify:CR=1 FL=1
MMPHKIPVFVSLILTSIGSAFVLGGSLALWDVARSTSLGNQTYWLPFMAFSTAWFIAADLFVFLIVMGAGMIAIGMLFVRVVR